MREIYAYFAAEYLEQKFLPLALQAAGLPPETRLDQLDALNLPIPNHPESAGVANDDAGVMCSERPLFCGVVLLLEFAQTSPARQICRIILGLMWRDAVEFALAKDLWTSYSFIDDFPIPQEYANRFYDAEAQWKDGARQMIPRLQLIRNFYPIVLISGLPDNSLWRTKPMPNRLLSERKTRLLCKGLVEMTLDKVGG